MARYYIDSHPVWQAAVALILRVRDPHLNKTDWLTRTKKAAGAFANQIVHSWAGCQVRRFVLIYPSIGP